MEAAIVKPLRNMNLLLEPLRQSNHVAGDASHLRVSSSLAGMIFAGAQPMPDHSARIEHVQRLLRDVKNRCSLREVFHRMQMRRANTESEI